MISSPNLDGPPSQPPTRMVPFTDSRQHLLAELTRIDLLVRLRVLQLRQVDPHPDDEFRGLYISEEEVDALLATPTGATSWTLAGKQPSQQIYSLRETLDRLTAQIAVRGKDSLQAGVELRLERVVSLFSLSPLERDALLICLAPEVDLKYERLYAYLQNDVTRKRPSVGLVLNLLCPAFEDRLVARQMFAADAPLHHFRILHLAADPSAAQVSLLARALQVDQRIADYLLGSDRLDGVLLPFAQLITPRAQLADLILADGFRDRLGHLLNWYRTQEGTPRGLILCFRGPAGMGQRAVAEALCGELSIPMLTVDLALAAADELSISTVVNMASREALLQGAALYCEGFENEGARRALASTLTSHPRLTILASEQTWDLKDPLGQIPFICVEFPIPAYPLREQLWQVHLKVAATTATAADLRALASKFRFGEEQIRDAVAIAQGLARWRDPEVGQITTEDLYAAARTRSNQTLTRLARKIHPKYTWADIVLPPDQIIQLREVCACVKHKPTVYGEWGFERKLSLSTGLNVLFAGLSGTGKTMSAEIIAGELGLDLYKIDLSTVVSKYIGETEKNLSRIFGEAETSNAVLFFDEADALFGKRSEVRDSHDRYANIEISYLLQRMEEYDGIAILATNLRSNLDDAFARRMHFTVEFPFPEEEHRRRIWEITFPPETPRAADIDFDFMARQFKISGGHIRNIIVGAAFLAAEDGKIIGMEHLIRATRREHQKMGKLLVESEFGPYFELIRSEEQGD
jgi:SpoVK/Ycf46/Vps4 family AAA+-type ATPase